MRTAKDKLIVGFTFLMLSFDGAAEIFPSGGLFDGGVPFYNYFVAKKLNANYYKTYCKFAEIPSFNTPNLVFIYLDQESEYKVVYRAFLRSPKLEMNDYFLDNGLNPLLDENQIDYLMTTNYEIHQVSKPIDERQAIALIEDCSSVLFVNSVREDNYLDGTDLYFSNYSDSTFVSGLVKNRESKIYKTYQFLLDYVGKLGD